MQQHSTVHTLYALQYCVYVCITSADLLEGYRHKSSCRSVLVQAAALSQPLVLQHCTCLDRQLVAAGLLLSTYDEYLPPANCTQASCSNGKVAARSPC
jgi:hypothetical protein